MNNEVFIQKLFTRAKQTGFDACEVYISTGSNFSADVYKGELRSYEVSDTFGLGFRGLYKGKMGGASTQITDDDAVELLVNGAKMNAELIENEDKQFLAEGGQTYSIVDVPKYVDPTAEEKIEMARALEKKTLAASDKIEQVSECVALSARSETRIVNSLGLDVGFAGAGIGFYVGAVAKDGEKVSSGWDSFFTMGDKPYDLDKIARKAADEALFGLDGASPESGKPLIILRNDAAVSLLSTYAGIFSADAAQKKLSRLLGREGEKIAADCVTVIDDPHRYGILTSAPFDGEGMPTKRKNVIENGTLTTLLHNMKTAHKQGVVTTGNASRGYASPVGIAPSCFYIAPGATSFDSLLTRADDAIVVTSLSGLHAGANAISGDFSLSAKGYRVRNGRPAEPLKQFTVSGNFYEFMKNILLIGDDLFFDLPGSSTFGSASLLVEGLSVAGK